MKSDLTIRPFDYVRFAFKYAVDAQSVLISPAKVNLFLKVGSKLSSGRHLIRTVIAPISLSDFVGVSIDEGGDEIKVETKFSSKLHTHQRAILSKDPSIAKELAIIDSADNLAARAAKRFLQVASIKAGVTVYIEKHIPFQAGLGGGSSNAAAVLRYLSLYFPGAVTLPALLGVASELGADVGPMVVGQPVFSYGTGQKSVPVSLSQNPLRECHFVVFKPPVGISTAWAYKALNRAQIEGTAELDSPFEDDELRKYFSGLPGSNHSESEVFNLLPLTLQNQAGNSENLSDRDSFSFIRPIPENDFQSIVFQACVELQRGAQALEEEGAGKVLLAGSGSAVIGIFDSSRDAERAYEQLKAWEKEGWFLELAHPLGW